MPKQSFPKFDVLAVKGLVLNPNGNAGFTLAIQEKSDLDNRPVIETTFYSAFQGHNPSVISTARSSAWIEKLISSPDIAVVWPKNQVFAVYWGMRGVTYEVKEWRLKYVLTSLSEYRKQIAAWRSELKRYNGLSKPIVGENPLFEGADLWANRDYIVLPLPSQKDHFYRYSPSLKVCRPLG
jgi:hypothetical protein